MDKRDYISSVFLNMRYTYMRLIFSKISKQPFNDSSLTSVACPPSVCRRPRRAWWPPSSAASGIFARGSPSVRLSRWNRIKSTICSRSLDPFYIVSYYSYSSRAEIRIRVRILDKKQIRSLSIKKYTGSELSSFEKLNMFKKSWPILYSKLLY